MTFYIVSAVVCIALSAFFSAAEMAFSSANRIRLDNLADGGSKSAAMAVKILDRYDNALSAILIGNNFVNIALSSIGSVIAIVAFSEEYAWLSTVIVTVAVIIFGETIPKIVAKKNANRFSMAFSYLIRALSFILTPVIFVIVKLVGLVTNSMKGEPARDEQDEAAQELQSIIETAEDEDVIDEDRSELMQNALDFNDVSAFEVMTARVDILAIDIRDDWDTQLETIKSSSYSRIPVYDGSIDNIVGVLYLNHFFKALVDMERFDIAPLLMKPCYVYKTLKLPAVLEQLKKAKCHLAIVTDEYGGCLGVITMEDVLEQIVGDIWDDTDVIEDEVIERANGEYELDGDMVIGDFIELIGRSEDDFETESTTVGGWTLEEFGAFPKEGDCFTMDGVTVTVLKMDGLRVERVLVKLLRESENNNR